MRSLRPAVLLAVVATLVLSGCTPIVTVGAADDAQNTLCAAESVRLPPTLQGHAQRETNGQATGAWGDPAAILLACGVPVPPPSTLPCVQVEGIYWIRDEVSDDSATFTTFGRDPATRVVIDRTEASPGAVLSDLSAAVAYTKEVGACTDVEQSL